MFEAFYNLSRQPFQLSPDPRFYFDSRSHKRVMAYLTYGITQGEGFIVITGAVGSGKTTVAKRMFSQIDPAKYVSGSVVTTQLDPGDTVRMIAFAFGLIRDEDRDDKATLLKKVEQFLLSRRQAGQQPLLFIDEVQNMPTKSLEELRMLSNFQVEHKTALQVILLGQPQFNAILAKPELEQLRQRVVASADLGRLSQTDTKAYIEHRLNVVGWSDDPHFTDEAYRQIFDSTDGLPRRINKLCSRLLLFGYLDQLHRIDEQVVNTVVEELKSEVADGAVQSTTPEPPAAAAVVAERPSPHPNGALLENRIAALEQSVGTQDKRIKQLVDLVLRVLSESEARTAGSDKVTDQPGTGSE